MRIYIYANKGLLCLCKQFLMGLHVKIGVLLDHAEMGTAECAGINRGMLQC